MKRHICKTCDSPLVGAQRKFCSDKCKPGYVSPKNCKECHLPIGNAKTFCSQSCKEAHRKHKAGSCKICRSILNKGKIYCSYECRANDPELTKTRIESMSATCMERYGTTSTTLLDQVKHARVSALVDRKEEINQKRSQWWKVNEARKVEINKTRANTNLDRWGFEYAIQHPEIKAKMEATLLERYGVTSGFLIKDEEGSYVSLNAFFEKYGVRRTFHVPEFKEKAKTTCFNNYGTEWYLASKAHRERQGYYSVDELDEYSRYRWEVKKATYNNKKALFERWDGRCSYTGEILTTNKNDYNNPLYATIDHVYAISLGYKNKISPEIIGGIDNLCICSRKANLKKNAMLVEEFEEFLSENDI